MNSTSLYVTISQIILKASGGNTSTWHDLYRLVPYLRNALCCVVCGNLLVDPLKPILGRCQHFLCRACVGGRKKIKPACVWCKDCTDIADYTENRSLRILLQCYKKMCIALVRSHIHGNLVAATSAAPSNSAAANLLALIREGAAFEDAYKSAGGLSKSEYSILPCVYTNSSTQTLNQASNEMRNSNTTPPTMVASGAVSTKNLYSVMFAGSGNKITIKRKPSEGSGAHGAKLTKVIPQRDSEPVLFKKPKTKCSIKPKKGCRCGNATLTPGKLTCCGQRCPCYVDSKACVDCKCRGCRNPHRIDGHKVTPHIVTKLPQDIKYSYSNNTSGDQSGYTKLMIPNMKQSSIKMESQYAFDHVNQKFTNFKEFLLEPIHLMDTELVTAGSDDLYEESEIIVDV